MRRLSIEERARILRALGTESRMQIIEVLKEGPIDVGDLAERLGISQSAVSQHLRVLKELRIVSDQRHSYFISYSINPQAFRWIEEAVMTFFRISYSESLKRKEFERRLRRERLLEIRENLEAQLREVCEVLQALDEEESLEAQALQRKPVDES